jgi:GWxTD domain-containing protein
MIAAIALFAFMIAQSTPRSLPEYWFDDDEWHHEVQYLITAEEISAYQKLKTMDERDPFISQFWGGRDPTPGTPQNEFREEFYRRVEYANMHFADASNPSHNGMETDRGRFYVMFGPPDRIDPHPTSFYEFWTYKSLFTVQFSVPPIESCDGTYRFTSPSPASFESGSTSVEIYPMRFITALIALDFSKTSAFEWKLRTETGDPVIANDYPILEGTYGPARGNEPFSKHLFGCRLFGTGGMAFTQPVPPGSYNFSTSVTLTNGEVRRDTVKFKVD